MPAVWGFSPRKAQKHERNTELVNSILVYKLQLGRLKEPTNKKSRSVAPAFLIVPIKTFSELGGSLSAQASSK
jgi:hypothetical protein